MPIGRIFLFVSVLGLIGLCVALVIGAAIVIVPVLVAGVAGIVIYRKVQLRRRLARFGE
jgi:Flp pilus assembly protein TadB